jgi:hypothetical protein
MFILLRRDSLGGVVMLLCGGYTIPPPDGGVLAVVDKGQKREDQSSFGSTTAWCFFRVLSNTIC